MATIKDLKQLSSFLFAPNYYAKRDGGKVYDVKKLTEEDRVHLLQIVNTALEPANLTCKFQLTGKTLELKAEMLDGAKRALEKYFK
jgi:hypothetical protein